MIVYRLSREKYKLDLSGKGAAKTGGRWNSRGVPVVYTSQSRALCTTEIAVNSAQGVIPDNYWLVTIELPDDIEILEINISSLPGDWKAFPHPVSTQEIGDAFVRSGGYLVAKVPSVVVPGDFNYLINPMHSLFHKVKINNTEFFEFDKRLFLK
ncbi:RES family NAD+ phosphorylase [Terrimonas ferruginea]|uniref:RES family NAD+ phosphorylase n=1 Tax=Terrimonas ferruginea TaxID=249 RepID=UPI00048F9705|nr:RES family NAD+ phosphorylase [Terrimonas ferruginea]